MSNKLIRLSEEDIKVVCQSRGYENNPYHYSNSASTYRLRLTQEERDKVAKARIERGFAFQEKIKERVKDSLWYMAPDYDITISIKNRITGHVTHTSVIAK